MRPILSNLLWPFLVCSPPAQHDFHRDHVLGTSFDLEVVAASRAAAEPAAAAALAEIDRLAAILSTWSERTPITALNRGEVLEPAPAELVAVLELCAGFRQRTGGAFDERLGELISLWRTAGALGKSPGRAELDEALANLRQARLTIDARTGRVTPEGGIWLNVDALAKGYIVDHALAAARAAAPQAQGLLLAIGGDMRAAGKGEDGKPWPISIADPRHPEENQLPLTRLALDGRAIATSGSYARGAHILDPRTGRPATGVLAASVVAPECATADALATALNVLEPERGLEVVAATPGAECLIVAADGLVVRSKGWRTLEITGPQAAATPPAAAWPPGSEVAITLTLANVAARGYRRPYVAVWIENEQKELVRTIALWGNERRWVPELSGWWRASGRKFTTVQAVSRATRPAGEYRLAWDGRDDAGKPLPPGNYTFLIEISREHGRHVTSRKQVVCGKEPFAIELPGNAEMQGAWLRSGQQELRR